MGRWAYTLLGEWLALQGLGLGFTCDASWSSLPRTQGPPEKGPCEASDRSWFTIQGQQEETYHPAAQCGSEDLIEINGTSTGAGSNIQSKNNLMQLITKGTPAWEASKSLYIFGRQTCL